MSNIDIGRKVKELRELRRMADELTAEIETLTDTIKAEMTTRSVDELTGTDYKITWRMVSSSKIDTKRLKADHADLCSQYTTTTTTRRFVLA